MSETDCIFCKIIRGEIPSAQVYSTSRIFAFLDIAPVNPGHALIIPKAHHPLIFDVPEDLGAELISTMKVVGKALMNVTDAEGLNIGMNNYEAAGQLVPHAHFHLIPRFKDDGFKLWPQKQYDDPEQMNTLAAEISKAIQS